ncbi:uncharacterized protein HMPREF1541_07060 [Cyphellophora europaea CBS 101466]|uniref:Zn(2)-C6 fungal-type domain-containing protein n=1 Tax=Cyphellophora europaea (strain CBS 101466) TaxID=1220924 RepID=W2RTF4_CYPE1|nr:uncharacterized protein HMPREF1541_07060 [Cyphellophora europaea CBS 101466]ETN39018.1 hypothetical protein HMPREF1541_07060 [Cyphellophora europaea CBS 101466]
MTVASQAGTESPSEHSITSPVTVTGNSPGPSSPGSERSSPNSSPTEDLRIDTQQSPAHAPPNGTELSQKRKRSVSDDDAGRSPLHANHAINVAPQHVADRALHMLSVDESSPQYPPTNGIHPNGQPWIHDAKRRHTNNLPTPDTPSNNTDERRWATTNGSLHAVYPHDPVTPATAQNKPRKRNFSNRTKTGCMTCRRRKKKCDEEKPICGNCIKAGQECEGYMNVNMQRGGALGLKTPGIKPVPLQSKSGPVDSPHQQRLNESPLAATSYSAPQARPALMDDHGHAQPTANATESTSDETRNTRPSGYPGPPHGQGQPWPQQQAQPPQPSSNTKIDLPPLTDLRRNGDLTTSPTQNMRPPTQPTPGTSAAMTQQIPHHHHPPPPPPPPPQQAPPQAYQGPSPQPSPYSQHNYPPAPPPPPPPQHDSYARVPPQQPPHSSDYPHHSRGPSYDIAPPHPPPQPSSHSHQITPSMSISTISGGGPPSSTSGTSSKTFNAEDVERSKMARLSRYNHLDATLVWERRRCDAAVERYNAELALTASKNDEEIRNSLWKVVDPSRDGLFQGRAQIKEKGVLSHGVLVERGFRCSYGYNLKLMDSVYIDRDVFVDDAAKVEIGARSWIGAGTTILTSAPCSDSLDRNGGATQRVANPVVIESEVQVGAGCIIYPGVRLGRGCVVKPGCVVDVSVEGGRWFGVGDGGSAGGGGVGRGGRW